MSDWTRLTAANVKRHITKGKLLLAVSNSKVYAGRVNEVTDRYVELQNGDDKQYLYHDQRLIRFQAFEPPSGFDLTMGEGELPL